MKTIVKQPANTLYESMNECNQTGQHRTAVIVFKAENWPNQDYSELSRSYSSHSNQWGWNFERAGKCRYGDCLDGTDKGVRLDWYKWAVEYWYWQD